VPIDRAPDLSRISPIDRPCVDGSLSDVFYENSLPAFG